MCPPVSCVDACIFPPQIRRLALAVEKLARGVRWWESIFQFEWKKWTLKRKNIKYIYSKLKLRQIAKPHAYDSALCKKKPSISSSSWLENWYSLLDQFLNHMRPRVEYPRPSSIRYENWDTLCWNHALDSGKRVVVGGNWIASYGIPAVFRMAVLHGRVGSKSSWNFSPQDSHPLEWTIGLCRRWKTEDVCLFLG